MHWGATVLILSLVSIVCTETEAAGIYRQQNFNQPYFGQSFQQPSPQYWKTNRNNFVNVPSMPANPNGFGNGNGVGVSMTGSSSSFDNRNGIGGNGDDIIRNGVQASELGGAGSTNGANGGSGDNGNGVPMLNRDNRNGNGLNGMVSDTNRMFPNQPMGQGASSGNGRFMTVVPMQSEVMYMQKEVQDSETGETRMEYVPEVVMRQQSEDEFDEGQAGFFGSMGAEEVMSGIAGLIAVTTIYDSILGR